MRISDWSSDVCSSDLAHHVPGRDAPLMRARNGDGDAAVFQPVGIIARPCRGPAFRGEETPRLYDCGSGGVQVRYNGRSIQYAINHPSYLDQPLAPINHNRTPRALALI